MWVLLVTVTSWFVNNCRFLHICTLYIWMYFTSLRLKAFTYECVHSNDITILILLTFITLLQAYYTQLNRNDSVLSSITYLQLCSTAYFTLKWKIWLLTSTKNQKSFLRKSKLKLSKYIYFYISLVKLTV